MKLVRCARTISTMHLHWTIVLLWCCVHIDMTECCFKSGGGGGGSSSPKTTTTTAPVSHRTPCSAVQVHQANCRNGGTCYVVVLRSIPTTICSCTPEWEGSKCERRYYDPGAWGVQQGSVGSTVGIAFGCVLGFLLIVLVVVLVYIKCFRARNRNNDAQKTSNLREKPEPHVSTNSENGFQSSRPAALNGYHNWTLSSDNTQRLSTLSAVSCNSPKQFETTL